MDEYISPLKEMFVSLQNHGSEVIFMTPSMMCTEVKAYFIDRRASDFAKLVKDIQLSGSLDRFCTAAKKTASECGVTVCDVYSKWKTMQECGVNF